MNKYIVITVLALAVLFVGVSYPKPSSPASVDEEGLFSRIFERISNSLGSVTGPESTSDYRCNNGVCEYYRISSNAATSTPCSFDSPNNATTTPVLITVRVSSTSAAISTIYLATSSNRASTSTTNVWRMETIPANSYGSFAYGRPSLSAIIAPGDRVIVSAPVSAPTAAGNLGLSCTATFGGI